MPTPTNWLERTDNAITYIREQRDRMADALSARGMPVSRNSSLATVATAVEEVAAIPTELYASKIVVSINAGPEAYIPPAEQARRLLDGAVVQFVAGMNTKSVPLPSLEAGTIVSATFPMSDPMPGLVRVLLNAEAVRGSGLNVPEIRSTFSPGEIGLQMDLRRTAAPSYSEIGFRVYDDMSFCEVQDIVASVGEDGVVSEADTGYLDAQTGKWVSTSPIERALPQVSGATGKVVAWNRYRVAKRNDLFGIADVNEVPTEGVWPFNACRNHVHVATAADGSTVTNRFVGIGDNGTDTPFWYIKVVHTTAPLRTKQGDGSFVTSSQNVTEHYIAATALDAGYRRVEIDYIGQYHVSRKTLSVDGANKSVEYSDATGYGPDIGIQRFNHQANIERVNDLPGASSWDGEPLPQAARQVSMFSYHSLSCLWPLIVMACGTRNGQAYMQGHTSPYTDEGPDSDRGIGVTKPIDDLGLFIGTMRSPDVCGSFRLFGIENLWGSIGVFLADVTNVGGKFFYNSDRRRWLTDLTPQVIEGVTLSADTLLRHYGYRELSVVPASGYVRALRPDDQDPDILVPTQPAVSSLPASSGTCYADNVWLGTSGGSSYFVAAGVNRDYGLQLGPFCLYCDYAWGNSAGHDWSARPSLRKLPAGA